jgi:heterodisulfide reductase subunit A-like polyferredoxin
LLVQQVNAQGVIKLTHGHGHGHCRTQAHSHHHRSLGAQHAAVPATAAEFDAIIIGSGMGGLTTAAQMLAKGAKVLVLEK